jgi:hypothetical protein
MTRVAGRLQEELCARIPEAEKRALRIALGLEHEEVILRMKSAKICCVTNVCAGGRGCGPLRA